MYNFKLISTPKIIYYLSGCVMSLPKILALSLSTLRKQPHIALFAVTPSIIFGQSCFSISPNTHIEGC